MNLLQLIEDLQAWGIQLTFSRKPYGFILHYNPNHVPPDHLEQLRLGVESHKGRLTDLPMVWEHSQYSDESGWLAAILQKKGK